MRNNPSSPWMTLGGEDCDGGVGTYKEGNTQGRAWRGGDEGSIQGV